MNQPKYLSRLKRRIGKVMLGFVLACAIHTTANSQTVNLSVTNQPITKVCKEIEKQTGFYFIYSNELKNQSYPVTVNIKNEPVKTALDKVFKGSPYSYELNDMLVSVNTAKKADKTSKAGSQDLDTLTVTGRIILLDGKTGLENASVMTNFTKRTSITNSKGEFKLKNVIKGEFILVSFIGYQQARVFIDGEKYYVITLKPAENQLDNVVIKAYGKTSKRMSTGSIVTVSGKEIADQPVMNPILALQGKVPGMVITQTSGDPSAPIKIEIRGRSSINPNMTGEPLYIIDGIPSNIMNAGTMATTKSGDIVSPGLDQAGIMQTFTKGISPLFGMNMDNIESVSVLKDADATAIYGSRGANGVIIINTKRGKAGQTAVSASISQGLTTISRYYKMLDIKDYLALRREAFANDGITPSANPSDVGYAPDLMVWDTTRNVNWQKAFWGTPALYTNLSSNISGGTGATTYNLSANYGKSNDISNPDNSSSQSTGVTASITSQALKNKLNINVVVGISNSKLKKTGLIGYNALLLPPNAPELFKADGTINYEAYHNSGISSIPVSSYFNSASSNTTSTTTSANLSYNIAEGLDFSTVIGFNNSINSGNNKSPLKGLDPFGPTKTANSNFGETNTNAFSIEPKLSYSTQIRDSRIDVFGGLTYSSNKTTATSIKAEGYTSDDLMGSMVYAASLKAQNDFREYKYAGTFLGIGYSLKDRYFVNLNGRRDGSSRFGSGKEFGNFGSVGVNWIISDEPFAKKILPKFISFMKLQSSYGITGSDGIGEYQYLQQYGNTGITSDYLSYNGISVIYPLLLANSEFHWESKKKWQASVYMGLFDERITIDAAYYRERCDNQLVQFPVGNYAGYGYFAANSPANVMNKGFDLTVTAKIINGKNFKWMLSPNINYNDNKLLSYPLFEYSPYYLRYKIGHSLNDSYKFNYKGIDPKTGYVMYEDANNDGKISYDGTVPAGTGIDDRIATVNTAARLNGGITSYVTYKKWALSIQGTFKRYNTYNMLTEVLGMLQNYSYEQIRNHWQYAGQEASAPKATTKPAPDSHMAESNARNQLINLLRINAASLSWSIPAEWARAAKMNNARLSLNANNLFLFTNYVGNDPENDPSNNVAPITRTIAFTLNATF